MYDDISILGYVVQENVSVQAKDIQYKKAMLQQYPSQRAPKPPVYANPTSQAVTK
jgi:hypothetical protein